MAVSMAVEASSVAQGIPAGVPQAVPIEAVVGVSNRLGHSRRFGLSLSLSLVVVVSSAGAVVVPVVAIIAVIAGPVPPCVCSAWPVVRALPFKLTTTLLFALFLVEVGVHNEGADEDEDKDGRETHFEN